MTEVEELLRQPQIAYQLWEFTQGTKMPEFLTAKIPSAVKWRGRTIFVTDAAIGTQFRASDGVAWRTLG